MDTVKKDVEGLKLDIGTIKESINSTIKLVEFVKELNKTKLDVLKEKIVEHTITVNLLLHFMLKDEDKVLVFQEKVKELKEEIYEALAKEFFEETKKEEGEDLQFMSGKH